MMQQTTKKPTGVQASELNQELIKKTLTTVYTHIQEVA